MRSKKTWQEIVIKKWRAPEGKNRVKIGKNEKNNDKIM